MKLKQVPVSTLVNDPTNARVHNDKNLDAIVASLDKFGQRKPIVVHNDVVIAGNGTLQAARKLGWETITITEVPSEWDDATAKAYALADNRSAELAEWDKDILAHTLLELQEAEWDLSNIGFDESKLLDDVDEELDTSPQDIGERYEVVISCADENEQSALLLRLSNEGLKVKALVL